MSVKNEKQWDRRFAPSYTPEQMLKLGVFEGKYINNIKGIPQSWKSLPTVVGPKDPPNPELNHFKVKSRQPLSVWKENGWIKTDANGWFEWYIHYYLGRRLGAEDTWQINRWRSFVARHMGQVQASCKVGDHKCHTRQRQGLLQWAWDSDTPFTEEQQNKNLKALGVAAASLEALSPAGIIISGW
jgi:hypothetical protein